MFLILSFVSALLLSYELNKILHSFFASLIPKSKDRWTNAKQFAHELNSAASPEQITIALAFTTMVDINRWSCTVFQYFIICIYSTRDCVKNGS